MVTHLSSYGLRERGFRLVSAYKCFSRGKRVLNIDYYTNGREYLVRNFYTNGHAWDDLYTDKSDANARVFELFELRDWHKKIL